MMFGALGMLGKGLSGLLGKSSGNMLGNSVKTLGGSLKNALGIGTGSISKYMPGIGPAISPMISNTIPNYYAQNARDMIGTALGDALVTGNLSDILTGNNAVLNPQGQEELYKQMDGVQQALYGMKPRLVDMMGRNIPVDMGGNISDQFVNYSKGLLGALENQGKTLLKSAALGLGNMVPNPLGGAIGMIQQNSMRESGLNLLKQAFKGPMQRVASNLMPGILAQGGQPLLNGTINPSTQM